MNERFSMEFLDDVPTLFLLVGSIALVQFLVVAVGLMFNKLQGLFRQQ
ncbi:hypothetical protein L1D44_16970 [Shewanella sp. Isolate13]|nr:hypothetical protein [Shewanella sp. Isolate13]MCG9731487.1 hypothetical protein [Shewanella sp. Isolate13]